MEVHSPSEDETLRPLLYLLNFSEYAEVRPRVKLEYQPLSVYG